MEIEINRSFHNFALATIALVLLLGAVANAQTIDSSERERWIEDGFPLIYRRDRPALDALWSALETAEKPTDLAVELQLRKQSARYKGRVLDVRGRLLRAVFVPNPTDDDPGDGYYDLWILTPDSKRDPIRVVAKNAPEGFQPDAKLENERANDPNVQYRRETVRATAIYYRTTAFDAGDDFRVVPTLVVREFQIEPERTAAAPPDKKRESTGGFGAFRAGVVLALVLLWFLLRRVAKKRRPKKASEPLPDKLPPFLIALALVPAGVARAQIAPDDVFWPTVASADVEEWARETGQTRPALDAIEPDAARRREIALALFARMNRQITPSVLRERASDAFRATTRAEYAATPTERRVDFFAPDSSERIGYFAGTARSVEPIALNPSERERVGATGLRRVVVETAPERAIVVYAPDVPEFNAPEGFFDGPDESRGVSGVGIAFGTERRDDQTLPVLLASKLAQTPDGAPLGRAGVDLTSFASVPVYPVDALQTAASATEREKIAKSLRWTTSDRAPFYQALEAYRRGTPDDKREPTSDVVRFFNRPEREQGRPVALRGWVRRVNMLLTDDPDVVAETKIDRYYQLYLFTNDSQGWPVVLCVPTLPEGLSPGEGAKERREIEFHGFFYKSWAYKTSEEPSEETNERDRWARVPVMIGAVSKVYPKEESDPPPVPPTTIFSAFAALALAWVVLRRLATRKSRSERSRPFLPKR